jgi:prepilin-type N-terminal cleavage/methylation domain-containing protein
MTPHAAPHPGRRQQGFTLLEMLIALTLVAMMAVSLWAVFRISIRSWQAGTESIDNNQRHRTILDLVQKQIASIYGLNAPVDLQTGTAPYPIFAGTETSLQCISLNSLRFQESPGLTMVSYDVVRDHRGNYSLVEREERYLGLDPSRESVFDRQDQGMTVIFDNLVSFTFEYFDPGFAERPSQWVRDWSAKDLGRLPAAVSLTMVALDARGERLSRHMVVPVLAKPYEMQRQFDNPFESRPRRFRDDDPRSVR